MDKLMFFCDATCDVPADFFEKYKGIIRIIGLRYNLKDKDSSEDLVFDSAVSTDDMKEFYGKMRKGAVSKTSLVTYEQAYEAFEPIFEQGHDVIHFALSSGLALTYENANKAGMDLAEKYGRKFWAPDTQLAGALCYMVLRRAVEMKNEGLGFEDIQTQLPVYYEKLNAFFTVESLVYLFRGGRISGAQNLIGSILNIKPILELKEGKLVKVGKIAGRMKSIVELAKKLEGMDGKEKFVVVNHADSEADAKTLRDHILKLQPAAEVELVNMGVIIGSHTGPGALAVMFADASKYK